MFFFAAKFVWSLLAPTNFLVLLSLLGMFASRTLSLRRAGLALAGVASVTLALCAFAPIGDWLLVPLEAPAAPYPKSGGGPVTGLVVLGGGENLPQGPTARVQANQSVDRIFEAARLARAYPNARVIVTGGELNVLSHLTEADVMAAQLEELSVSRARIERERRARDTFENAVFSKAIAQPKAGERWLLVTSAFHMRRSLGAFRRVGFPVVPAPSDWRSSTPGSKSPISASENLQRVDIAAKEYFGLLAYWARGRLSSPFPSPS